MMASAWTLVLHVPMCCELYEIPSCDPQAPRTAAATTHSEELRLMTMRGQAAPCWEHPSLGAVSIMLQTPAAMKCTSKLASEESTKALQRSLLCGLPSAAAAAHSTSKLLRSNGAVQLLCLRPCHVGQQLAVLSAHMYTYIYTYVYIYIHM